MDLLAQPLRKHRIRHPVVVLAVDRGKGQVEGAGDGAAAVVDGPGDGDGVAGVGERGGAEVEVGLEGLEGVAQFLGAGVFARVGRQAAAMGVEEVLALVAAHDGRN